MRTPQELDLLRERAVTLRRQGKSRSQIKQILGPMSNSTLNNALKDEPLPPERADRGYAVSRRRATAGVQRYWAAERLTRETARAAISTTAAARIGPLTAREVIIAGAIAYWCEGAKSKPYRIGEQVRFINSDPELIRFFLKFLDTAGVSRERLRYCVYIHESADVQAATSYWASIVGVSTDQLVQPVIKRHTPRTSRTDDNAGYHGCLQVSVAKGNELYREISGWAHGVMTTRRIVEE